MINQYLPKSINGSIIDIKEIKAEQVIINQKIITNQQDIEDLTMGKENMYKVGYLSGAGPHAYPNGFNLILVDTTGSPGVVTIVLPTGTQEIGWQRYSIRKNSSGTSTPGLTFGLPPGQTYENGSSTIPIVTGRQIQIDVMFDPDAGYWRRWNSILSQDGAAWNGTIANTSLARAGIGANVHFLPGRVASVLDSSKPGKVLWPSTATSNMFLTRLDAEIDGTTDGTVILDLKTYVNNVLVSSPTLANGSSLTIPAGVAGTRIGGVIALDNALSVGSTIRIIPGGTNTLDVGVDFTLTTLL